FELLVDGERAAHVRAAPDLQRLVGRQAVDAEASLDRRPSCIELETRGRSVRDAADAEPLRLAVDVVGHPDPGLGVRLPLVVGDGQAAAGEGVELARRGHDYAGIPKATTVK